MPHDSRFLRASHPSHSGGASPAVAQIASAARTLRGGELFDPSAGSKADCDDIRRRGLYFRLDAGRLAHVGVAASVLDQSSHLGPRGAAALLLAAKQVVAQDVAQGCGAVPPGNLLALSVSPPVIGDRHLVDD